MNLNSTVKYLTYGKYFLSALFNASSIICLITAIRMVSFNSIGLSLFRVLSLLLFTIIFWCLGNINLPVRCKEDLDTKFADCKKFSEMLYLILFVLSLIMLCLIYAFNYNDKALDARYSDVRDFITESMNVSDETWMVIDALPCSFKELLYIESEAKLEVINMADSFGSEITDEDIDGAMGDINNMAEDLAHNLNDFIQWLEVQALSVYLLGFMITIMRRYRKYQRLSRIVEVNNNGNINV